MQKARLAAKYIVEAAFFLLLAALLAWGVNAVSADPWQRLSSSTVSQDAAGK